MKNTERVRARIAQAFATSMDSSEASDEIAFHMTDWDHDVDDLVRLYETPEAFSDDELVSMVFSSLRMFRIMWPQPRNLLASGH